MSVSKSIPFNTVYGKEVLKIECILFNKGGSKMKNKKQIRYYIAMALSAIMIVNTMPIFAEEVMTEVSEYIHDENCNHIEGHPCIHEHTEECTTLICNDESEEHSHNDECFELNCTHFHNADCEYVEAIDCTCMKRDENNKENNCTLDKDCILLAEHEGECVKESLGTQQVTVVDWKFNGAEDVSEGVLALPGVNSTNQIDFETLVSMLPTEISILDGDTSALSISDWRCPEFKKDTEGNWPISGEYIFVAELPTGYDFESTPSVKVLIGGAELYGVETGQTVGDFIVTGDAAYYAWKDSVLTIKDGANLTIKNKNEVTKNKIVVVLNAKRI